MKFLRIRTEDGTITQTNEPPNETDLQLVDNGDLKIIRMNVEHDQMEESDGTTGGWTAVDDFDREEDEESDGIDGDELDEEGDDEEEGADANAG